MFTQEEYNTAKYGSRKLFAKVNVLNHRFQNVGVISGVVLGTPSFTNDSNSSIRRTCRFEFYPKDSSFDIVEGSKIWIDKYIQVDMGIKTNFNDDIIYTNMGMYLLNDPSQTYSAEKNIISIDGYDLMAKMTGLRGGNLEGLEYVIPAGSNVRDVLIDTLALFGFTKYIIEDYPILTPYDISIPAGGCGYDIIKSILDILPNWQAYFDVEGTFRFDRIPSGYQESEQVEEITMITDDLWQSTLIGYTKNYDETNIKNYIEVLGKPHDNALSTNTVTIQSGHYKTKCSEISSLANNLTFGFTTPSTVLSDPIIEIDVVDENNNTITTTPRNIRVEDGSTPTLSANTLYYVQYVSENVTTPYYKFLGGLQPYGVDIEENENSPFCVNGSTGVLRIILSGGNYNNINSDYLAKQRAEFELYQRCRLQDKVTIQCVPIYFLDTNWLIEITLPNRDKESEETAKYLIKSINTSCGVSEIQTIQLMRYYPYYNY